MSRAVCSVIGQPIDVVDWNKATSSIVSWAEARERRYVCICNTHSLVVARDSASFASALECADMNTADGAPVAFMMRLMGNVGQDRINGPDLMIACCERAAQQGVPVFFYGSTEETLQLLVTRMHERFPGLLVAGHYSPPFRELSAAEEAAVVQMINSSGAGIVWVGLGCPKQEIWMKQHRDRIDAVLVGVGAAFDYHAGVIRRAPVWMQKVGLEWFFRLCAEPRRLWRRYFYSNTAFIVEAIRQFVSARALRGGAPTGQR